MQLIDLSQTISSEMPQFSASWPAPTITPYLSHTQSAFSGQYSGVTVEISFVQFITSIGTYLDSPFHFNPDGASIEKLDLHRLILPGTLIRLPGLAPRTPIGPEIFDGVALTGRAVLIQTGWSAYWGMEEYAAYPFLTEEAAVALRDGGAAMLGLDTLAADDMHNPRRPVHATLLHGDVLIVENLAHLDTIPDQPFTFHAVPAKVAGAAAFPVRAYAMVG